MSATVISEFQFGITNAQRGLEVVHKIWSDMQQSADCLDHEVVSNQDVPGHILVVSHWTTGEAAQAAKNRYAAHPNAIVANELASGLTRYLIGVPYGDAGQTEKVA